MNEEIDHGYYSIEVSAENPETFVEARFYDTGIDVSNRKELDNVRKDTNKKELSARKIRGEQRIIVRDYISDSCPNEKTQIVRIKAQEILDSITRTYLGNYAEFWVPIENVGSETGTGVTKQSDDAGGEDSSATKEACASALNDDRSPKGKEECEGCVSTSPEVANPPADELKEAGTVGTTSEAGKELRGGNPLENSEVDAQDSIKSDNSVQCKKLGCMCCWLCWLNPLIRYTKKAIQSFTNNEESQANTPVATKNITYRAKQIDPPHQIPIINGRILRVHGIRSFHVGKQRKINVRIHDLKLGELSFATNSVVIHGVDLRVQGNKITLNGDSVQVKGFNIRVKRTHRESTEDAKFILIVKGSAMRIEGVRADNIDAIRISDDYKIKTVIEEPPKEEVKAETNRATLKSIGYSFKFLILLGTLVWLTFLPFCKEGYFREKYKELVRRFPAPVVEVMKKPVEFLNKICIEVFSSGGDTNQVATTSTNTHPTTGSSVAEQEKTTNGTGGGVVTFYFVLACLLYVVLYVIVIFVAFATFKAMRRHNKMTRNMSAVIEALRNERDKEKRRAMQKKILDDMIDTYLDRPSSDE